MGETKVDPRYQNCIFPKRYMLFQSQMNIQTHQNSHFMHTNCEELDLEITTRNCLSQLFCSLTKLL